MQKLCDSATRGYTRRGLRRNDSGGSTDVSYRPDTSGGMLTGCGNRKGDTVASFIRQDQGACRHGEEEHRRRGGVKGLLPDS